MREFISKMREGTVGTVEAIEAREQELAGQRPVARDRRRPRDPPADAPHLVREPPARCRVGQDARADQQLDEMTRDWWKAIDSIVASSSLSGAVIGHVVGGHLPQSVRMGATPPAPSSTAPAI